MSVYFIRAGKDGPIKIGVATDPAARLRDLQTAHHETLHLERVVDGERCAELWLHEHFSEYRLRGEWFRFHPSMLTILPPPMVPVICAPDSEMTGTDLLLAIRALGLSQRDFAKSINYREETVSRWVRDREPFHVEHEPMTTFQQYGIVPCAYAIPTAERREIAWRGPEQWVIAGAGCCLNTDDEWEVEPQPSSRTDEFKARTRYSLQEAMERAVRYFRLGLL